MPKMARDVMTTDPTRCSRTTTLDQVATLMRQYDCGEIPIVDSEDRPVGVVTDRDIVCRVVAEGKNPTRAHGRRVHDPAGHHCPGRCGAR